MKERTKIPTPQLDRIENSHETITHVNQFLNWLETVGLTVCVVGSVDAEDGDYIRYTGGDDALIARYLCIDLAAADLERQAVLEAQRTADDPSDVRIFDLRQSTGTKKTLIWVRTPFDICDRADCRHGSGSYGTVSRKTLQKYALLMRNASLGDMIKAQGVEP